jgi:hypothetical protein
LPGKRAFCQSPYASNLVAFRNLDPERAGILVQIVDERPGFLGAFDFACSDPDINRIGLGIAGHIRQGFRLAR